MNLFLSICGSKIRIESPKIRNIWRVVPKPEVRRKEIRSDKRMDKRPVRYSTARASRAIKRRAYAVGRHYRNYAGSSQLARARFRSGSRGVTCGQVAPAWSPLRKKAAVADKKRRREARDVCRRRPVTLTKEISSGSCFYFHPSPPASLRFVRRFLFLFLPLLSPLRTPILRAFHS